MITVNAKATIPVSSKIKTLLEQKKEKKKKAIEWSLVQLNAIKNKNKKQGVKL